MNKGPESIPFFRLCCSTPCAHHPPPHVPWLSFSSTTFLYAPHPWSEVENYASISVQMKTDHIWAACCCVWCSVAFIGTCRWNRPDRSPVISFKRMTLNRTLIHHLGKKEWEVKPCFGTVSCLQDCSRVTKSDSATLRSDVYMYLLTSY